MDSPLRTVPTSKSTASVTPSATYSFVPRGNAAIIKNASAN